MKVLRLWASLLSFAVHKMADQTGSLTLENWWVHKFHDQVATTYQQMSSLLMGQLAPQCVRRGVNAAVDYWERISNVVLPDGATKHGQSVIINQDASRRQVIPIESEGGILVSDVDTLRSMANPQSEHRNALVWAAVRRADKHIIDASIGTATTVTTATATGALTTGTQAMLGAHQIGAATAMDLNRIINANELLSKGSVPTGPRNRLFLYSAGQLRDILAITQASSSDFTKNQIHDRGSIDGVDWEGFNWIEIQDVVNIGKTVLGRMLPLTGTTRSCIAMAKDAVGLSISRDYSVDIDKRPDLRNEIQVYLKMRMAAVRIFETGVVQVDALEN